MHTIDLFQTAFLCTNLHIILKLFHYSEKIIPCTAECFENNNEKFKFYHNEMIHNSVNTQV